MQKQKRGFLLFICSLIPGAGEMYMGFFKQGISIMTLFWAIVAIAGGLNIGSLVIFLPVIWFYSFFHVHNLKELPEEEFYAVEDNYVLHLDRLFGDTKKISPKHTKIAAILLIFFGAVMLWNSLGDLLFWILPEALAIVIRDIMYQIPSVIIGLLIIIAGYHLLTGKIKGFQSDDAADSRKNTQEHYWQPYRPYQQPMDNIAAAPKTNAQQAPKPSFTEAAVPSRVTTSPEASAESEAAPASTSVLPDTPEQ